MPKLRLRTHFVPTILVALLIFPLPLSLQTSGFSLSLDLDTSEGDQAVQSVAVSSPSDNQIIFVQIFGRDIQNAFGLSARFEYDVTQVVYEGFDAGDVLPDPFVIPQEGTRFVVINMVLEAERFAIVNSGLMGTLRFRTTDTFGGTTIRLMHAELLRDGQSESAMLNLSAVLQVSVPRSPDIDRNGVVDVGDFLLFVEHFGVSRGHEAFSDRFDLNGNGKIDFSDFSILTNNFGKAVPVAVSAFAPVMLGNAPITVDVSGNFSSVNSDVLHYSAVSGANTIATASVVGSEVTISPVDVGSVIVTVIATNARGLSATENITVTVQRAMGFAASSARRAVDENTLPGEKIGDPVAVMGFGSRTYRLSGADADSFAIDTISGQILTREGVTYNYEGKKTYFVRVVAIDGYGSESDSIAVIVRINDMNEPPSSLPSNFLVIPDDEWLSIHYTAVPDERGRPLVRGYHAEIRKGKDGPWGTRKIIYGRNNTTVYYHEIDAPRYQSRFLINGQLYQVRVRAYNSEGAGEWSAPVSGTPVYVPPKPEVVRHRTEPEQFQGADGLTRTEIDLSDITGKGSKVIVQQASLPTSISLEEVEGIFVEIVTVEASNVPDVPAQMGFTILESSLFFDIDLKALVDNRDVDIGSDLREPVEICLPISDGVSDPVIIHYNTVQNAWTMLDKQRVDGDVVCGYTDIFSLFGVAEQVNRVPVAVGTIVSQKLRVGDASVTVDVSSKFYDPDGDQLTYTAMSSDENIATVSATGSVITITPVSAGNVTITVTGSDSRLSVDQTFKVTVSAPPSANNAPVITSASAVSVIENTTDVVTVVATDADSEDSITGYTLTGGVDQAQFEITNGGVLSFKIAPNFEAPTDVLSTTPSNAASNNEYIVEAMATSGTGARVTTATQTLTITVTDVDAESPGSPAAPTVSASTLNSLTVTWSAPANTGPAISAYDVRYILTSADETVDANWTEIADAWTSGALTYTISSLTQNTSYDVQVRAKSDEGTGDWSASVTVTTDANNAPVGIGKIYWADRGSDKIQRSNLDGSSVEDLVMRPTLNNPVGIALDVSSGKTYWMDETTDKIQRSNLDGTSVEDLITTGLDLPSGIALDVSSGKMYWMDRGTDKIQRSNLDGSGVEDLVTTNLAAPVGIALDISGGKMYWVDGGADKIQRANLDGTGVEDLVTGVTDPRGIALDISGGKMYWVDGGADKIQRANLDGTGVEDLVTGVTDPRGIALDISGGKMYWVDNGADKIQRSNLDGTSVEDVLTSGLTTPISIALDVISDQILMVGTSRTVDVSSKFYDPDGDQLTYTAMSSDENIATVSTTGSVITITPVSAGNVTITVTGSDSRVSIDQTFTVIVVAPPSANNAPVITSVSSVSVSENSTEVITVTATDADTDDTITGYAIAAGGDGALFSIVSSTGVLSFTSAPDFESPTDVEVSDPANAAANNEYIVTVSATSGTGNRALTANQTLTVTVTDVTEVPSPPDASTVTSSTISSLTITWTAPTNTGPAISAYDVRYILTSADETVDANWTEVVDAWTSGALTYTISSLTLNTSYDVQVRAKSDEGTGDWSASVTVTTDANNAPVGIGQMYWADRGSDKIQRSNLDGSSVEDLVMRPTLNNPVGIALDVSSGKTYWMDETTDKIQRSNLDGTSVEDLITTGLDLPSGIALDVSGGKLYWMDRGTDKIQRSNLDGTGVEDLITTGLSAPVGIALDISGGKMYWVDNGADKIQRANLDGSSVEDLVTGVTDPRGIALDVSSGKMYWVDNDADKIQRANLDGSSVEDLITTGLTTPVSIALDVISGQILTVGTSGTVDVSGYFSDPDGDQLTYSALSSDENIATVSATGSVITITPVSGGSVTITVTANDGNASAQQSFNVVVLNVKMYWTDRGTDKIQRANIDGSSVEDLVSRPTLGNPVDIALDISGGKMYWIDEHTDKIQRASLDGSGVEDLITAGLDLPTGIALDLSAGKLYWMDRGTDKIQRSNLDGTGVEDLVTTGLQAPSGITLDISGGKMYWVDDGTNKIQRTNIELAQGETTRTIEDLVTGLTTPVDISLDISGGKMYWTDRGTGKIQRTNIELAQGETTRTIEDLVSVTDPRGIALDISGGKIYWTDNSTNKIQRASLDGTGVEDLITTGLTTPVSIALGF